MLAEMPDYALVGTPVRLPNNIVRGYLSLPARTNIRVLSEPVRR